MTWGARRFIPGMTIRPCRLNICSVKAVPTPTVARATTAGGALLGSTDGYLTTTEVTTPPTATEPTLEALSNTSTSLEEPTVAVLREITPLTTKNNNNIVANNNTPLPEVAATVHDQEWFVDDPAKVACEWQLPFSQLGSQNKDGVHAGTWWRPPKLILMS